MKPEAVIFDMDGVLVNSEEIWRALDGNFLTHFPDLPAEKKDTLRNKLTGRGLREVYDLLHAETEVPLTFEEFAEFRIMLSLEQVYPQTKLIPGAHAFLQSVAARFPTGLGSSSPRALVDAVFAYHPIKQHFHEVVCSEDVHGICKPAPDIFLLAASRLGIAPDKCLVIEDSANGILAAKTAGMTVWAYKNAVNNEQDLSQADMIFESFFDLTL